MRTIDINKVVVESLRYIRYLLSKFLYKDDFDLLHFSKDSVGILLEQEDLVVKNILEGIEVMSTVLLVLLCTHHIVHHNRLNRFQQTLISPFHLYDI